MGAGLLAVFLYWMWKHWHAIVSTFERVAPLQFAAMIFLLFLAAILTALAFSLLVRGKGYRFSLLDGYNVLNLSQLASMIPGGIWGFAGLAGALWAKGVSKADSLLIIFLHTLVTLTACAMVGVSGLAEAFGAGYALLALLPFLAFLAGRDRLERLRQKFLPASSPLPPTRLLVLLLLIGMAVWLLAATGFTWLAYASAGGPRVPFWSACGAYAAGYLAGYLTLFAPSGLGVSEGVTTLLLAPALGSETALAAAISFRIVHTLVNWSNILATAVLTVRNARR